MADMYQMRSTKIGIIASMLQSYKIPVHTLTAWLLCVIKVIYTGTAKPEVIGGWHLPDMYGVKGYIRQDLC